jgi:hypothetical protein
VADPPFESAAWIPEEAPGLGRFAAALRELSSRQSVDETLQLAVDLSTELIRGCALADVMLLGPKGTTTPVSSDELARAVDEIQSETGEGPCRDAAHHELVVRSDDLAEDRRWPIFGPKAAALGVHSAVSFQLFLNRHETDRFGALNLYGYEPASFDDRSVALGDVLAALCSSVLAAAVAREGLHAALQSRDLIGQAKGVLMERHRIAAAEAFQRLKDASQSLNRKVTDVAAHVAETGELPS